MFRPGACQLRILHEQIHRVASARRGKAELIVIYECGTAIQYLVLGVTDESQPRVGAVLDFCKGAMQIRSMVRSNDELTILELEVRDAAPGRIVNPGDCFLQIVRAELRRVR